MAADAFRFLRAEGFDITLGWDAVKRGGGWVGMVRSGEKDIAWNHQSHRCFLPFLSFSPLAPVNSREGLFALSYIAPAQICAAVEELAARLGPVRRL